MITRFMFGGIIAFIAFIAVFITSFVSALLSRETSQTSPLVNAAAVAITTLISALLLTVYDDAKHKATIRTVRRRLLAAEALAEEQLQGVPPHQGSAILLETRRKISRFYRVPIEKVSDSLRLVEDLSVDKLSPAFQYAVVDGVLASQEIVARHFHFSLRGLETVRDLADAIQRIVDDIEAHR